MQPVLLRGRTGLALPVEEFAGRAARIQDRLARRGLAALVVFGDARHYAPLTWVTGLVPMLRWAVAIVPAEGGTALYTAMAGARDLPSVRRLAAVDSAAAIGELPGALQGLERVAVAGRRSMRAVTEAMIAGAGAITVDGDLLLGQLMVAPSPSERELLHAADRAAAAAAAATVSAWAGGASGFDALLAGDLCAREAGMNDVRMLWSLDGGATLRPPERPLDRDAEPSAFYLAVQTGGYWGEALRSFVPVAGLARALSPIARLGLSVDEGVEPTLPGVYSRRLIDADGLLGSVTIEVM